MNVIRKIMVGLGSIVVVALVLALASPKSVRAVVSALVTVSNTASNPVPTVSSEAAKAFVAEGNCTFFSSANACTATVYTVPSGETAVVESLSDFCAIDPGTQGGWFEVDFTAPAGSAATVSLTPTTIFQSLLGTNVTEASANLKFYAAGGTPIQENLITGADQTDSGNSCRFTISGYLVP
jgi:hypothetical protein